MDNSCLAGCPVEGYFADLDKNCQDCDSKCKRCQFNSTYCLECHSTGIFQYFFDNGCLEDCPEGFYPDIQKRCLPCDSNCLNCTGPDPNQCTSCKLNETNRHYLESECLPACPPGYTIDGDFRCQNCDPECETCHGPTSADCDSCFQNETLRFFYNDTCLEDCPGEDFYYLSDNRCLPCDSLCRQCDGGDQNDCLRCYEGGSNPFLLDRECLIECPVEGYYADADKFCQPCDGTCKSCSGPSALECLSCKSTGTTNLYFYSNECREECPVGFYPNSTNHCLACHGTCRTCLTSNTPNDCQSCDLPLKLYSNQCLSQCPDYFANYQAPTVCDPCHDKCVRCDTSSASDCSVCKGNNRIPPSCVCELGWVEFEGRSDFGCYQEEISNLNHSTVVLNTEISLSQCQTFDIWNTSLYTSPNFKGMVVFGCFQSVLVYDIMAGVQLNFYSSSTSFDIR